MKVVVMEGVEDELTTCETDNNNNKVEEARSLLHTLRSKVYFHNISRIKSNSILETVEEGVFLVRPSTHSDNPLTLSLRHNARVYNINIRKRRDGLFALGTGKTTEMTFNTVDELVRCYRERPGIKLQNGDYAQLTNSPPNNTTITTTTTNTCHHHH
ncbi:hypothetical protein Pcinc_007749 [Petrolisthes cinctipes]|uniref:SH2 domain-containing protein n=1 Tax=Petrolisthes cinctipes TaxID=88211 RepID=A0AAE1G7V4_PETCI|nr:hypothetical protein Pcinc_007749 [Petrolisthes cinctipes]